MQRTPHRNDDEHLTQRALDDVKTRRMDVRAVVSSAMVGGAVFLVVAMAGHALLPRTDVWDTPVRLASLLLGEGAYAGPRTGPELFVLALVLHAMLSLVYAMLIGLATRRMSVGPALLFGGVLGLLLYAVNYYALTPVFPAFAAGRGPVTLAAHLAFGLAVVAVFHWSEARHGERARQALRT